MGTSSDDGGVIVHFEVLEEADVSMGSVDSSINVLGSGSVVACEVQVLEEADATFGIVDSSGDDLGSNVDGSNSESLEVLETDSGWSVVVHCDDVCGVAHLVS